MEKYNNNIDIIEVETFENSKTISFADNGFEINQIKYSSNSKYFVTHNAKDKTIIGWSVGIDEKTIEQDKFLKYSKNGFLEDSDQFVGITVDDDDVDFGKKQDSSSDESIDVTIENVSDDKYILVSNHFENKSYYKLLDFSKKNVNYFEISHKMDITFDQGFFFGNNKIIMGKLEEDYYEIHLFTYDNDSKNNPVVHKATRRLYNICNPDFFSTLDDNLLIASNGILLSEWKLQWNNGTFLRKKNHYLLLKYDNIYFNKNNLLMVTYNKSDSKLLVHSLKDDVVISSSKLEENIDIKKLDFYTKDQLEFLLIIYSKHNTKNYQCQLMDPYNLDNVNDVTNYFNEYIIENTTEDILFGRVLLDNKIIMIIKDQLLTKEFINEEKLEKLKKHREQLQKTPKTIIKKSLRRNLILPLKILYRKSRLLETSEHILVKGKDIQWLVEYEKKFKNIKIKIPKFYNKSRKNLITIDDDETFEDYGLLYNDDLILLTKKFKRRYRSKGIHILSFNTQNKIYTKYVGYVNYMDNKELIEKIKQVFNNIGDSYIDKEQLKGKTFEEMIPYMLEDLYYFSRHGDKVLKFALRNNDIVIVEQIFDSCLNWFKKEASSNHSLLKIIISNLSELQKKKYQHLLSKFFIQTSMLLDPSCNSITISEIPSTEILQLEIDKKKKKEGFWQQIMMLIYRVVLIVVIFTNVYQSLSLYMNISLFTFIMFLRILIPVLTFIIIVNKSHDDNDDETQPSVRLLVPFPKYKSDISELCKHQNGQVILDFKWNTFGFKYHVGFLTSYMAFLLSFAIASTFQFNGTTSDNGGVEPLLYTTIVFGSIHLILEIIRVIQSLRMKGKFFSYVDFWFLLDIGAYSLPVATSAYWLINNNPPPIWAISLTNLLLDLKFMLFLRCFSYFGAYFAIILGVARKVFSFLVILFIIIVSFSHAFYIMLTPKQQYSLDVPIFNDDSNNPWQLTDMYKIIYTDGDSTTYNDSSYIVRQPDGNTNGFTTFPLSMLAIYNFLAGDKNGFEPWAIQDDPYLAILVVLFSFLIVVYLMNLFIGLLSNEIQNHDTEEAFYTQKAKVITSVELLFDNHRNLHPYFITYYVPVEDIRKRIREVDNSEDDPEYLPYISDDLRKLVNMPKPENDLKNDDDLRKEIKSELKNEFKEIESGLRNDLKKIENQIQLLLNEIKSKDQIMSYF